MGGGGGLGGMAPHSHHGHPIGPHLTFDCAAFIAMPSSCPPPPPSQMKVVPPPNKDLVTPLESTPYEE